MTQSDSMHATCVAWADRAVLITGQSGSGKSALGLSLLGFGCVLVADDQLYLSKCDGALIAQGPKTIAGLIEARGIGVLNAAYLPQSEIVLAVDLDKEDTARLPQRQTITLLGCTIPLIYRIEGPHFAAAILQILKGGWSNR